MSRPRSAAVDGSNAANNHDETDASDVPAGSREEPPHIMGIIGADPVGVQGSGPHKNLVVGSSVARTPNENFTERNLVSAKSTSGAAL